MKFGGSSSRPPVFPSSQLHAHFTPWLRQSIIEVWQRCDQSSVVNCGCGLWLLGPPTGAIFSATPGYFYGLGRIGYRFITLWLLFLLFAGGRYIWYHPLVADITLWTWRQLNLSLGLMISPRCRPSSLYKNLENPGIEPGPPDYNSSPLPLYYRGLLEVGCKKKCQLQLLVY